MQASDGSMYATFEQYTTGTPVYPIYHSTNAGQTWTQVGSVSDTHKGYGMRYQPFLYQLPQAIGSLAAGTLLCAGNCIPSSLASTEIDIYYSTNSGVSWTYLSTVCTGGEANPNGSYTPVWEPFLMVYNNQLVCYYSDERQKPTYNQCLGHETSSNGTTWSAETYDVALSTANYRPGMAVVSKMANGSYILTYEVVNYNGSTYTNQPTFYKTSTNPLSWTPSSIGTEIAAGGCPYVVTLSDGKVVVNNYDSGNLYVNSNNGTGSWTTVSTPMGAAYSRCLVPLSNGRLFIIGAGMIGGTANTVTYADMAQP
jgi:hypothetical protein